MSFLEELKVEYQPKASAMLIYGEDGTGKTTFATRFKNSCIIHHPDEDGVGDLKTAGLVDEDYPAFEVSSWSQVNGLVDELLEAKTNPFQLVTFDTANTCPQRLLFESVQKEHFEGEWSNFQNWDKGAARAVPDWEGFLTKLTKLRAKGVRVILLAHAQKTRFKNPEGNDWIRYQPDLYHSDRNGGPSILNATKRWATDIGFLDFVVEAGTEKGKQDKAKGGRMRRIRFNHEAAFDAKNRAGITAPVNLGFTVEEAFTNFCKAFSKKKDNNG